MWSGPAPMFFPKSFFWALLLLSCGFALWRGRRDERMAALIFISASIVSVLARSPLHQRYLGFERSDFLIDSLVLVATVAIALRSERFWPLWIAGLQLTVSMSHLMKAVRPDLMPLAYAAAERFWSYPTLIILFIAAWRQHRRRTAERQFATAT